MPLKPLCKAAKVHNRVAEHVTNMKGAPVYDIVGIVDPPENLSTKELYNYSKGLESYQPRDEQFYYKFINGRGVGVFARRAISKTTLIRGLQAHPSNRTSNKIDLSTYSYSASRSIIQDENTKLSHQLWGPAAFINGACAEHCNVFVDIESSGLKSYKIIIARKDIAPDEELLLNYEMEKQSETFPCPINSETHLWSWSEQDWEELARLTQRAQNQIKKMQDEEEAKLKKRKKRKTFRPLNKLQLSKVVIPYKLRDRKHSPKSS